MCPDTLRQHLKSEAVVGRGVDLITVNAPRAENPNLHAQDGLFTLYRPRKADLEDSIDRRSLDKLLLSAAAVSSNRPLLYRFVAPIKEAGSILYLIAKEGIDSATLLPGYAGVVTALHERALWDR